MRASIRDTDYAPSIVSCYEVSRLVNILQALT